MKLKTMRATLALLIGTWSVALGAHVSFGIAVGTPPPPPPVVVTGPVGVAPGPGYFWVPGHWDWVGDRWVWVEGAWVLRPHARAVWVAPAFREAHGHYYFRPGRWR